MRHNFMATTVLSQSPYFIRIWEDLVWETKKWWCMKISKFSDLQICFSATFFIIIFYLDDYSFRIFYHFWQNNTLCGCFVIQSWTTFLEISRFTTNYLPTEMVQHIGIRKWTIFGRRKGTVSFHLLLNQSRSKWSFVCVDSIQTTLIAGKIWKFRKILAA